MAATPTPPPPLTSTSAPPSTSLPLPPPPHHHRVNNLTAALSTLKHLIHLSQSPLSLLSLSPSLSSLCPFNPNHRLPPESLFSHILRRHHHSISSPLNYPNTLSSSSSSSNNRASSFFQTLDGANRPDDLCFSIDEYFDDFTPPGFFYRDCPGAVSSCGGGDGGEFREGEGRTFTLPGILSVECANFPSNHNDKLSELERFVKERNIRVLPSEVWFIRTEVDKWNDYPTSYSYCILRAIVCSLSIKECGSFRCVITNSLCYGIVIDVPMRDHIVLLFRLCLKAIAREAVNWAESVLIKDTKKLDSVTMSFNCPILVEVIKWFSFQLSVLYGQVNGKRFAIDMLKQWLLDSSENSFLFWEKKEAISTELDNLDGKCGEPREKSVKDEGVFIFVSQVAAAVAALHERALFEQKLKAQWNAKPLTSYQRAAEHAYLSKRADDERNRRTDYRPLLEHDGFIRHRSNDQEGNSTKTREELLAEERDYKRQRASYRGKKLKRNPTEVMRDIIENYMESIRQAGGIGCLTKGSNETEKLSSELPSSFVGGCMDLNVPKQNVTNSSIVTSDHSSGRKTELHSYDDNRYTRYEDEPYEDRKKRSRDSDRYYEYRKDRRNIEEDRGNREYKSRSGGNKDHRELSKRKVSHVSGYDERLSHDEINNRSKRGSRDSEWKDRRDRSKRDHRADSVSSHVIDDRYEPYESRDKYKSSNVIDDRYDPYESRDVYEE